MGKGKKDSDFKSELNKVKKEIKETFNESFKEIKRIGVTKIILGFLGSILLGFAILFVSYYVLKFLYALFSPIITNNIESTFLFEYISTVIIGLGLASVAVSPVLYFYHIAKRKINHWIFAMVFLMLFFLISGFFFIDVQVGLTNDISFILRDTEHIGKVYGEIHCTDADGRIYVGERVKCNTTLPLTNSSYYVVLRSDKEIISNFTLNDYFIAPEGITKVGFQLTGYDNEGKFRKLATGWRHSFLTEESVKENRQKFLSYLFALLSLVFVLVPTSLSSIKHLLESKRK